MKRIRAYWIWVLFVFVALVLISFNAGKRRSWTPVEQAVIEITAPIQKAIRKSAEAVERVWLKYFSFVDLREENTRLKEEVDDLRMQNDLYRELASTHARLRELLQFKESLRSPVVAAQVIGRDPTGWFESVFIDKGTGAGLRLNMPVVDARGVVGRLVAVSPHYAKVLLIVDQNSAVDCLIQRTREKGILKGLPSQLCRLHYVSRAADVAVGDKIVTSGLDRIFPKGLPVGEVTEIADTPWEFFKDVRVKPSADFSRLEEVLVLLKEDPLSSPSQRTK
ncbi:MAG: rod shape-determining protein MreC [Desulfobacterota bacterium]|nr:rod shape-determining protein MreC [Thermodesulfobacteriota bacterium]